MRFDLPPHPFHLLGHGVCPLLLSRGSGPVGFMSQHGKWRLEAVREVARTRDGSADCLFAVLEQHVEIVDERLHFSGVDAVDSALTTGMHGGQPRSQPVDGRQPAPHLDEPDDQADERENRDAWHVQEEVVKNSRRARCRSMICVMITPSTANSPVDQSTAPSMMRARSERPEITCRPRRCGSPFHAPSR